MGFVQGCTKYKVSDIYYHLSSLILTVNLTQPRGPWEDGLKEGLSMLGWLMVMPVGD